MNADPRHPFEISHDFTDYPFPMSNGRIAHILIPGTLTPEDATRMVEMLKTLVPADLVEVKP
jgi:hypothetical protein